MKRGLDALWGVFASSDGKLEASDEASHCKSAFDCNADMGLPALADDAQTVIILELQQLRLWEVCAARS